MKKHSKLTVCLVAGVLVLSVSAFAALGSVSGYARYKDAVKALALNADNFTASATVSMKVDGNEQMNASVDYLRAGQNYANHTINKELTYTNEQWETLIDGTNIWFDADNTVDYYVRTDVTGNDNLLGIDTDEELTNRIINFTEIAADTIVGELKNNFVQTGSDENGDTYSVDISKNQVPSLINAGLSLAAYSVGVDNSRSWWTTFEDRDVTAAAYYEKTTGEALPEGFLEAYSGNWEEGWYEANQEMVNKYDEVTSGMYNEYDDVLDENDGGVVFVHTDGSYDYYADETAFFEAHPERASSSDQLENMIGQDAALEHVSCVFTVDKDGNLTANKVDVTFSTTGKDGSTHEMVITLDATLSNFGTTQVTPYDVGGRTAYSWD